MHLQVKQHVQETIRKVIHEPRLVKRCVLKWWNHYSLIKSYSTVDGSIDHKKVKSVRQSFVSIKQLNSLFLETFWSQPQQPNLQHTAPIMFLKPHLHCRKILARLGWKKYAYQKNWFGMDRFCCVNNFALSVPSQNFTCAWTYSQGSPNTNKIGTGSWKSSPGPVKCKV